MWSSKEYARGFLRFNAPRAKNPVPTVRKPTVRKPRVDVNKLFRNKSPVETTVEDSPCVDVYKLFLNASPVVTTVEEEVISHETITRKEPLRRSKRIAALKKKNAPLRRSPRIASMKIKPNYKE